MSPDRPRLLVARGSRAVQDAVLTLVEQAVRPVATATGNEAVGPPLRVITATGGLRRQLIHRLLSTRSAWAGLDVVTLWTAARQIVQASGESTQAADPLLPMLAARACAGPLAAALARFDDGLRAAVPAIRDLLAAGLEPAQVPRLLRALGNLSTRDEAERAALVVRAAAQTRTELQRHGLARFADRVRRAGALLEAHGESLWPARQVLIVGFADATGDTAVLLRAILQRYRATLLLDLPFDPAEPGQEDAGARFARRFAAALLPDVEPQLLNDGPLSSTPALALIDASGVDAELRAVAERIGELLDRGIPAESIGVVARSLEPYAIACRRIFEELGIPFSGGEQPAGLDPIERRLGSWLRLIADREQTPLDPWVDSGLAVGAGESGVSLDDLRLALRTLGARRLADVAQLDPREVLRGRSSLPLPVRRGLALVTDEQGDADPDPAAPQVVARHRSVAAEALLQAQGAARAAARRLAAAPQRATLAAWHEWAQPLIAPLPERLQATLGPLLSGLARLAAPELLLERQEWVALVKRALEAQRRAPLGGAGGGVVVTDAPRARGLGFGHLFLLGANAGSFPAIAHDDPLLGAAARAALAAELPALAQPAWRADEERLLFAGLLAAAPEVTIAWQRSGDDGRERATSPYVARLLLRPDAPRPEVVPRDPAARLAALTRRSARESLRLAALRHDPRSTAALLPAAFGQGLTAYDAQVESIDRLAAIDTGRLAQARIAVLAEYEADFRTAQTFGPYSGFIGPPRGGADPRRGAIGITTLERVARCGWQALLERILRLERPPDPAHEFPAVESLLIGLVAHQALQQLVQARLGQAAEAAPAARTLPIVSIERPSDQELERLVERAARDQAREAGLRHAGLIEVLAGRALVMVRRAVELEWQSRAAIPVIAVEHEAAVVMAGDANPLTIPFRADRVDREPSGRLTFTDYKVGKPLTDNVKSETRERKLIAAVARGERLQAAAYAASERDAIGRYLFIDPGQETPAPALEIGPGHGALAAFDTAARTLHEALTGGVLLPRLIDEQGNAPKACGYCAVREACLQEETGARHRLSRALQQEVASQPRGLVTRLWTLGRQGSPAEEADE